VLLCGGNAGLGDDLLLTATAHGIAGEMHRPVVVVTRAPELFHHNPDIAGTLRHTPRGVRLLSAAGVRILAPDSDLRSPSDTGRPIPDVHFLRRAARSAGLSDGASLRPRLHLTAEEKERGARARGVILIQSSISEPTVAKPNKEWFPDRFTAVARELAARGHRVAQVGLPTDAPLGVGEDFRDTGSPRDVAALLANAKLFVGLVGFLMHAASAVKCPAVIVYGGRESPAVTGYPDNENLFTSLPCAPCWEWTKCDYGRECMRRIQPADVVAAAERQLVVAAGPP
jgi:hypothetical protein